MHLQNLWAAKLNSKASISCCLLAFLVTFTFVLQPANCQSSNSTCVSKKTCGECIRTPECVWCAQPIFNNDAGIPLDRCNTPTTHMAHPVALRCTQIINPSNQFYKMRDDDISQGQLGQRTVQIQPQQVSLKLRVGQAYDLNIKYAQAEDYPVDLYYLMDLSKSMEDDKETLSKLGGQLAEAMQRMTSKFKLGFGSFVDKVVMPFVSTVEKNLLQPCPGCESPYGYQNVMSLDQDTARFAGEVERARVSGNLDAPEGGFDAVMQAIVCDEIGWRNEARRLLVFSTDASFHYAGDGKLGGIVKPNDGQCHMDARGEYTHSTIQDYPSVAQINSKVKEKNIHMIFAVTAEQVNIYEKLTKSIQGSSCGELAANSSNVVELVREEYKKITSTVELKDTSNEFVRVSYFSKCLSNDPKDQIERNKCSNLRVGSVVEFLIQIELVKCPTKPSEWQQYFEIYPVGLTERLRVELEMLCQCDCERPEAVVRFSPHCGGHGTEVCGICDCDDNYFGRSCECNTTFGSQIDDDRACRLENTSDVVCSNRGECVCGQCQCYKRNDIREVISGPFCQCDNFSCERVNTVLCSGEDHGKCVCGKCECEPNWEGPACECPKDPRSCRAPDSNKVCDGHGECVCGRCICHTNGTERYSGKYCNRCPGCPDKCEYLKNCIQCYVHATGTFSENEQKCEDECFRVDLIAPHDLGPQTRIKIVDVASSDELEEEIYCSATDETDDCRFYYVYGYNASNNNELYVRAQKTKDCPPKPPIMWIIFGVVGAIVLVGLVFLLLWKLLTHIHDRAEYARFEKERMNAKWDAGENPIYKQATSTFKNPMYAGR